MAFLAVAFSLSIMLVNLNQEANGAPTNPSQGYHNVLFQDNYSSSAGWIQIGTSITVNGSASPGVVKFNDVAGGQSVSEQRVFRELPSALPDRWVLQFDYKFTQSTIPTDIILALTDTSIDPQKQLANESIFVEHGGFTGLDVLSVDTGISTTPPISISANTQYYITIEKTPTQLKMSVFSDPARTIQVPGSPVTETISPSDFKQGLKFIQHDGCFFCGSARMLTAEIDNTEILTKGNQ